LHYINWIKYTI